MREDGSAVQAHRESALKIGGEDQRQVGVVLELVGEAGGAVGLVVHQERAFHGDADSESAYMVFSEIFAQDKVFGAFGIQELDASPRHDQLPYFFIDRHLAEDLGGPFFAVTVEVNCR